MIVRAFITHKKAEKFADCQDRFGVNIDTKSISVSDGMSQSWQQKIWAQLLVDTFVDSNEWLPTNESIKPLCNKWREEVEKFIQSLKDKNAPENIIFRNERNFAEGRSAGATFVGVRFNGMNWSGTVLGDSCLVEWDGEKALFHTSQDTETFDNRPDYFDSNSLKEGKGMPKNINGTIHDNSVLLLVSDPFSDFLFEHNKQGDVANYIPQLLGITSHDEFETLVDEWRKNGMHNDDSTLVIIENDGKEVIETKKMDEIKEFIEQERIEAEKIEKAEPTETQNRQDVIVEEKKPDAPTETISYISTQEVIEEFFKVLRHNNKKGKVKQHNIIKKVALEFTGKDIKEALTEVLNKYSIIKK